VSLITTFAGSDAGVWEVCGSSRSQASPWSRSPRLEVIEGTGPDGQPALDTSRRAELRAVRHPGNRHGAHRAGRPSDDPAHDFSICDCTFCCVGNSLR
jgi:hypothetical protein